MKVKRPTLPRKVVTPPYIFVAGLVLVGCAFTGVVLHNPDMLTYFYIYYGLTVLIVMMTFARVTVFTSLLKFLNTSERAQNLLSAAVHQNLAEEWVKARLRNLWNQRVVYF